MGWTGGLLAAAIVALLFAAAWADVAIRIIPDGIAAAIAVLGITARLLHGPRALAISLAIALAMFAVMVVLHARGMLGGGDVKLATALCFGFPLPALQVFVFVTAMSGGVLALLHLLGRWALRRYRPRPPPPPGTPLLRRVLAAERWRMARHAPLPYGVAIACGGSWAVLAGLGG